ncbi:MAG: class I SAM-dependent methyltransferase [bacterium]
MPWLTYPAIVALSRSLTGTESVFEFGSGGSTLWFAERVGHVVSIEGDKDWHDNLQPRLPDNATLVHHHFSDVEGYLGQLAKATHERGAFDVVLVDGGADRSRACELAAEALKPSGLIILDNSDVEGHAPGVAQLHDDSAFRRIDFHGPGPVAHYVWCTSFFFKDCARWIGGDGPILPRPIHEQGEIEIWDPAFAGRMVD